MQPSGSLHIHPLWGMDCTEHHFPISTKQQSPVVQSHRELGSNPSSITLALRPQAHSDFLSLRISPIKWKWYACVCSLSCGWLYATPWTVAHQALLSTGFSRQEYWSGLPLPTAGDLLKLGMEPSSLTSPVLAGGFFTTMPPGKPQEQYVLKSNFLKEKTSNIVILGLSQKTNIMFLKFLTHGRWSPKIR